MFSITNNDPFQKRVNEELKSLSVEQQVQFAWRCSIRALPILGYQGDFSFWKKKDIQKHLYSIFFAQDVNTVFVTQASYDIGDAAELAGNAADNDSAAAVGLIAAHTAQIIHSAVGANAADTGYATEATIATYDNACAAAGYTAESVENNELDIDLNSIILQDLADIKSDHPPTISVDVYGEIWNNFQTSLRDVDCGYWASWFFELFINNFDVDVDEVKRRIETPEEIKAQGAAAVGKYMERTYKF